MSILSLQAVLGRVVIDTFPESTDSIGVVCFLLWSEACQALYLIWLDHLGKRKEWVVPLSCVNDDEELLSSTVVLSVTLVMTRRFDNPPL